MKHIKTIMTAMLAVLLALPVSAASGTFINEPVKAFWPMDNIDNYQSPTVLTPSGGFSEVTFDLNGATATGTANPIWTDHAYLKIIPPNSQNDSIDWILKPTKGLTFTPTRVSAEICRFGTDSGLQGMLVTGKTAEGKSILLGTYTPARGDKEQADDKWGLEDDYARDFTIDLTAEQQRELSTMEGFFLEITIGTSSVKEAGFGQVSIEGVLNGTVASLSAGDDFEYEGIWYTVIDTEAKTCMTRRCKNGDYEFKDQLIIPAVVSDGSKDYTVIGIGDDSFSFSSKSNVTSVVLPNTLTYLGDSAFSGFSSLTSVDLPSSLEQMRDYCFYRCTSLSEINIPERITEIPIKAFDGCSSLEKVNLPGTLNGIGVRAFKDCISLTSIILPSSMKNIDSRAFEECTRLVDITYLASKPVATYEDVFSAVTFEAATLKMPNASLTDVRSTVPWSLFKKVVASDGSIGLGFWPGDFEYKGVWYSLIDDNTCKTQEGDYVPGYGHYACQNDFSGDLIIPAFVTNGLNNYTVVEIGRLSFCGNTKLTSVSLPASIERIGENAFLYCEALTKVQFASLESLCRIDFESNPLSTTHHLYIGDEEVTEIIFPESLMEVKPNTFVGCSYLTTVILHDGITSIGDGAFSGCSGLSSIKIPDSVNSIGEGAFSGCSSLTSVSLPEGLSAISCGAFSYCSGLTEITLPASLSYLRNEAFQYCTALRKVTYNATTPIVAEEFVFMSESEFESGNAFIYNNATLNMPNAKLADIQATVPWNLFRHIVASDGSIGMEESFAPGEGFEYNGIRYEVIDPAAKTCKVVAPYNIGVDVTIPGLAQYKSIDFTVVELGEDAFRGCAGMLSITLPATVQTVGSGVFKGCDRLSSIIWSGNSLMTSALLRDVENPNVLVYVDAEQYAPAGLDYNVVAGGVCENLMLTPGYPFRPNSDFTANSSRMTKEFMQQTAYDGCSGWETIELPFDAVKVTSPEGHTLIPYGVVTDVRKQRPFWLYEADPEGEWKTADRILAGVPYLISMPNNPRYNPAYNVQGAVTFSNPSPQFITTGVASPEVITWASGREFRSLWIPLSETEAQGAMGLNVNRNDLRGDDGQLLAPGSAFCAGVTPQPMEAYVTTNGTSRVFPIKGFQSAVLMLDEADGLSISQEGAVLMLKSGADRTVDIYAADGTLLRRVSLQAGEPVYVDGLPQGVCLVAGSKIMIR